MIQALLATLLVFLCGVVSASEVTLQCWPQTAEPNWESTLLLVGSNLGLAKISLSSVQHSNGLYFDEYRMRNNCFLFRPLCNLQLEIPDDNLQASLSLTLNSETPLVDQLVGTLREESDLVSLTTEVHCHRTVH